MVRRPALSPRAAHTPLATRGVTLSARGPIDHRGSAGALNGAPLDAVQAETSDFLITATAEIAAVRWLQGRPSPGVAVCPGSPVRDGICRSPSSTGPIGLPDPAGTSCPSARGTATLADQPGSTPDRRLGVRL